MKLATPSSRSVLALLLGMFQVGYTAVHTFGWQALRGGAIDLRPFGRGLRALALVAIAAVLLFLLGTLAGDTLRLNGALTLLENDSTATRALLVPTLAVPLTLIGLAVGWSMLLAGAATARGALRWPTLLIYLILAVFPFAAALQVSLIGIWPIGLAAVLLLLLLGLYIALPRLRWGPVGRWAVFFALHGGLTLLALYGGASMFERFGSDMPSSLAATSIQAQFFFIVPFLVIAGIGWVDFAIEATTWASEAARARAARPVLIALLLGLLGWRAVGEVSAALAEPAWGAWGGAALLLAGLLAIGALRRGPPDDVPRRMVIGLALAVPALQLLLALITQTVFVALLIAPVSLGTANQATDINSLSTVLSNQIAAIQPLDLALCAVVLAIVGWRRGWYSFTSFCIIVAWTMLVSWLTADARPLGALHFNYAHVDALALPGLLALTVYWLARGRLSDDRALRLLALAIVMALLNQPAFLDNPFSPLFGFAGVAFLVFGVVWNILTAGGSFVNRDTPGLSGSGRLLLYFGYVLVSVAVIHWYVASHNIAMQLTQSRINESGFLKIGLPLIYLALVERGVWLVPGEDRDA